MKTILGILDMIGSFTRWVGALVKQARRAVWRTLDVIQQGVGAVKAWHQQVGPAIGEVLAFLPHLPDALEALVKELQRGEKAIHATGYGFAIDHMRISYVLWAGGLPPNDAPRIIRRNALDWTRSEGFARLLKVQFTRSRTLRRHWRCVRQNLAAHQGQLYVPATRSTLSDIEGIFGDGLIIQDRAWGARGKMYRAVVGRVMLKDGRLKSRAQTRPKDRQELVGLTALVEWSGLMRNAARRVMADLLLKRIAPERNPILHGRWTTFGTAARSTQMLLVLWVVAHWVVDLEHQSGPATPPRRLN